MPRRKLTSEDRVRVVGGRKLLVRPDEVPVASNARWLAVLSSRCGCAIW